MKTLRRFKKLSSLLTASLRDIEKASKSRKYIIDMNEWHDPIGAKKCAICQAGATMAMRLGASAKEGFFPPDFDLPTNNRLYALNMLREGRICMAAFQLDMAWTPEAQRVFPEGRPDYDLHGDSYTPKYLEAMHHLVKDLKRAGL